MLRIDPSTLERIDKLTMKSRRAGDSPRAAKVRALLRLALAEVEGD